jgi:hypothetical protein
MLADVANGTRLRRGASARKRVNDKLPAPAHSAAVRIEQQLALFLMIAKTGYTPQAAYGPYNVDFLLTDGIHPVAVEIHGGPKDERKRRSRLEYLIEGPGLSVVEVFVGKWCRQAAVTIDAAARILEFHKAMQQKALRALVTARMSGTDVEEERVAEHLMLWGDGSSRPGSTYPFVLD